MRTIAVVAFAALLPARWRERLEPAVHGHHRQTVPGNALVWIASDGPVHEAQQSPMWPPPGPALDAAYASGSDLSGAQHK